MLAFRRFGPLAAALFLATAGCAGAQTNDPSFRLTNNSASTINEIYVSSANTNSWGPDRLGDRTLASGGSYVVRLPAGQCVNDIRVVYANGSANERRRVNTCNLTDIVFP
ncbi:hypothetical protein [Paracraurococcus ruber]|uniref:Secreted protein n=1 Tax=Paracraurococcus ruber TaxID=77675 RepID=A0ABS1CS05_9PROT|nr:hypothetical protein [Paracraurococcus ruber]MBK1657159.1 hypothetical protein [Paracraurococcus ruber]TDG31131.1 hypothetical protein E2C05_12115 [Paracraurococcus ruber]